MTSMSPIPTHRVSVTFSGLSATSHPGDHSLLWTPHTHFCNLVSPHLFLPPVQPVLLRTLCVPLFILQGSALSLLFLYILTGQFL